MSKNPKEISVPTTTSVPDGDNFATNISNGRFVLDEMFKADLEFLDQLFNVEFRKEIIGEFITPKCECGSTICQSDRHSSWCPAYTKDVS